MEEIFGKHFSITEPQSINTVIYKVNKTEKEFLDKSPKFTIERLRYSEEFVGNNKKKIHLAKNEIEKFINKEKLSLK